jgi:hypothetical protein
MDIRPADPCVFEYLGHPGEVHRREAEEEMQIDLTWEGVSKEESGVLPGASAEGGTHISPSRDLVGSRGCNESRGIEAKVCRASDLSV